MKQKEIFFYMTGLSYKKLSPARFLCRPYLVLLLSVWASLAFLMLINADHSHLSSPLLMQACSPNVTGPWTCFWPARFCKFMTGLPLSWPATWVIFLDYYAWICLEPLDRTWFDLACSLNLLCISLFPIWTSVLSESFCFWIKNFGYLYSDPLTRHLPALINLLKLTSSVSYLWAQLPLNHYRSNRKQNLTNTHCHLALACKTRV